MVKRNRDQWQPVIGLEVHVQLNTASKLFSSAANRFGDEPNTNITDVCTGQPGTLPVLNKEAVKKAVLFGLAVHAEIATYSTFARKSYFYPDSPRNFQITQFEHPIVKGGQIETTIDGIHKIFAIEHAHLEDDAGMLKHFSTFAGVDYNRAGVPLLEIVSMPQIYSSKDAVAYVKAIKAIMEYIDASDCNMEEGSLRIDANISVRKKTETVLRNKTEIKNLNSFMFLELALEAEIDRQIELYETNHNEDPSTVVTSGTYRWDVEKKQTVLMRKKEAAYDYRYFPEPDLPPIVLTNQEIDALKATMPELPEQRYKRYIEQYHLSEYAAELLIKDKCVADFFEEGLKTTSNAKSLCNWITVEFYGRLKEKNLTLSKANLSPLHIATLVKMIDEGTVTGKIAKKIADEMIDQPEIPPEKIIEANPEYKPVDDATIEPMVDEVLKANSQSVDDFKAGKTKAFAYLVGQVMKLCRGQANPQVVNDLLLKKINKK